MLLHLPPHLAADGGIDEMLAAEQLAALAGAAAMAAAQPSPGGAHSLSPTVALSHQRQQQPRSPAQALHEVELLDAGAVQAMVLAAGDVPGYGGPHVAQQAATVPPSGLPVDLRTSIGLMTQAAALIRGLHEELQRSKAQVRGEQGGGRGGGAPCCCAPCVLPAPLTVCLLGLLNRGTLPLWTCAPPLVRCRRRRWGVSWRRCGAGLPL